MPEKPTPDTTAPVISDLTVTPARAAKGEEIKVSLSVNEELKKLTVLVAGRTADCSNEGNKYDCKYTLLGDESAGKQVVEARAWDLAGNLATARTEFILDFAGPVITLTDVPPPLSNLETATVAFTADEEEVTFRCSTDGAEPTECTSPYTTPVLPEGRHVVVIYAVDDLGNEASARTEFTTDRTAPTTTLLQGIPALTNQESHTITFRANDLTARFECRLDDAAFATCTSPHVVTGYSEGEHTFELRALDEVGNAEDPAISIAFVSDRTPPVATLDPVPDTGAADVTLTYAVDEAGSTVTCLLDGVAYEPCVSPVELTGLTDGQHSFDVRATDAAGNVQPNFDSVTFVVDTTAPSTSIFGAPPHLTNQTEATIQFSSNEPGSTFQCSFDGADFADCTSPYSVNGLTDGEHIFEVTATDRYGNVDATPAKSVWTVDTIPPVATFLEPVPALWLRPELTITFESDEEATFTCSLDGAAPVACTSPYTLTDLTDTLTEAGPKHVIAIVPTDRAGNVGAELIAEFDVDLSTPNPGVVRLLGPDPSKTSNTTPSFVWEGEHADSYDLEISTDPTFEDSSKTIVSLSDTPDNFFTPTEPLEPGKYYVRLRGKNITGYGEYHDGGVVEIVAALGSGGWQKVERKPTTADMRGVACKSPDECIFVGASGTILRTNDGGRTLVPSASPVTSTINNVEYVDDDVVVAVGASSTILRSNNGGITWSRISTDAAGNALPSSDYRALHFKGGIGIVGGSSGHTLRTDDAGRTWTPVTRPSTSASQYAAWILSTNPTVTALMLDYYGDVRRTTDGGATWSSAVRLSGASWGFSLSFIDDQIGFASSNAGRIYRTTNGGITWQAPATTNPHTSGNIEAVVAVDANTAVFVQSVTSGSAYSNLRSVTFEETSATWTEASRRDGWPINGTSLYGLTLQNGSGFAVGAGGSIFQITASETTLSYEFAAGVEPGLQGGSGDVREIQFVTPTTGYVVGTSGLGLKTVDGGRSFSRIDPHTEYESETIYGLHFLDENVGWVAGSSRNSAVGTSTTYPYVAKTTDGGQTFTRLPIPANLEGSSATPFYAVHFLDEWTGVVAGVWSTRTNPLNVLRWDPVAEAFDYEPLETPAGVKPSETATIYDIRLASPTEGYLVGSTGIFAAYDATQAKWITEAIPDVSSALYSVAVVDADTVVVAGGSGTIARRVRDPVSGTVTWSKLTLSPSTSSTFYNVHFEGSTGWVVGSSGSLWVSNDGGESWAQQSHNMGTGTFYSFGFIDPSKLFIGASSGALWRNFE